MVVKATPSNRAPGPDGLSGSFYKATWDVIGPDVVRAFRALWDCDFRSFHLLNEAIMVLIHKTQTPAGLKDYRPISLIHSLGKLFSKALALRLAPRMHELVSLNQSAFIQGRRIHENFKTVQLACRWLHARRCPAVLLLAKAFDSVAWTFLLEVLEHAGFPARWRDWISTILYTASTWVLVNGRPGDQIRHARGLRQGDPLSPLLFVIVMEVLNELISEADRRGVSPLPSSEEDQEPGLRLRRRSGDFLVSYRRQLWQDSTHPGLVRWRLRPCNQSRQMRYHAHPLLPTASGCCSPGVPMPGPGLPHQVPRHPFVAHQDRAHRGATTGGRRGCPPAYVEGAAIDGC